jgi:PD-(D/E)XK endonuclease
VVERLGLSATSGNVQPHIKSHTVRLGLDTRHLNRVSYAGRLPSEAPPDVTGLKAQPKCVRVAAGTLAAAWFALRGCNVALPVEPAAYDLLLDALGTVSKVQVKSTTYRHARDGWIATVGHHPDTHAKRKGQLLAYDPDEIDLFFIVDGDMTMYLIPSRAIAGRVRILLRTYAKFIVGNARGLLGLPETGDARAPASA